jgi:hypothetical protein
MKNFLKFLLLIVLAANMFFLFVLGGRIPEGISLPAGLTPGAAEDEEEMTAQVPEETEKVKTNKDKEKENGTEEPEKDRETRKEAGEAPAGETGAEAGTEAGTEEGTGEEAALPSCRIISENGSNIRSGPGMDFEVVRSYPYDTLLLMKGAVQDGWYPIQAEDGTEGYIFETQIELPEDYDPAVFGLQEEGLAQ